MGQLDSEHSQINECVLLFAFFFCSAVDLTVHNSIFILPFARNAALMTVIRC